MFTQIPSGQSLHSCVSAGVLCEHKLLSPAQQQLLAGRGKPSTMHSPTVWTAAMQYHLALGEGIS